MSRENTTNLCYLDKVRITNGTEELKEKFYNAGLRNKEQVIPLINDQNMFFCSLYVLLPEIEKLNLYPNLNNRNRIATKICAKILKNATLQSQVETIEVQENLKSTVLKWMWNTGVADDGMEDDYDEILDGVASLLVNQYQDKSILPMIVDVIFKRNQKGYFIHNLVWVLFKSKDPMVLQLIAPYLKSTDQNEVELACQLLNIERDEGILSANTDLYTEYSKYLKENSPYFYYTGETMSQASNPKPFKVDLKSKYANATISRNGGGRLE